MSSPRKVRRSEAKGLSSPVEQFLLEVDQQGCDSVSEAAFDICRMITIVKAVGASATLTLKLVCAGTRQRKQGMRREEKYCSDAYCPKRVCR